MGPGLAARTASCGWRTRFGRLARSTVALTILTNAPEVLVLGLLSVSLWLGWPDGPHDALRTLPAAGGAAAFVATVALTSRTRSRADRAGLDDSACTTSGRSSRCSATARPRPARCSETAAGGLAGAMAYYAFDNAVLWAAFHASGGAPAVSVVVMGYVVGSLGTVLPLPAGIGAVEGGLFGALVLYGAPAAPTAGAVLLYRGVSVSLPVVLSALAWALAPGGALRHRRPRRSKSVAGSA